MYEIYKLDKCNRPILIKYYQKNVHADVNIQEDFIKDFISMHKDIAVLTFDKQNLNSLTDFFAQQTKDRAHVLIYILHIKLVLLLRFNCYKLIFNFTIALFVYMFACPVCLMR